MSSTSTSPSASPVLRPRQGMERKGTHLFSLPSSPRHQSRPSATSLTDGSSITLLDHHSSRSSSITSLDTGTSTLETSAARLSLSSSSQAPDAHRLGYDPATWALLSIERLSYPAGMVLVSLYHVPSQTLYSWPMQTVPSAAQPKQGTVFVNRMPGYADIHADKTSESLKVLAAVLMKWMTWQKSTRPGTVRSKLGENGQDTFRLALALSLQQMATDEAQRILHIRTVRPPAEWSRLANDAALSPVQSPRSEVGSPSKSVSVSPSMNGAAMNGEMPLQPSANGYKGTSPESVSTDAKHEPSRPSSSPPTTPNLDSGHSNITSPSVRPRRSKPMLRMLQTLSNNGVINRDGDSRYSGAPKTASVSPPASILKTSSRSSTESVPNIEISSPNTTERLSWGNSGPSLMGTALAHK